MSARTAIAFLFFSLSASSWAGPATPPLATEADALLLLSAGPDLFASMSEALDAHPAKWAPALLDSIGRADFSPSWRLAAAKALLHAGSGPATASKALAVLAREAPLVGPDDSDFIHFCQKGSAAGGDPWPCAARLLSEPKFLARISASADGPKRLSKAHALSFILLPAPELLWSRRLGDYLWAGSGSEESLSAAAVLLFHAASERSDAILLSIAEDPTRPRFLRELCRLLFDRSLSDARLAKDPAAVAAALHVLGLSDADEPALRKARSVRLAKFHAQALNDLEPLTFLIRRQADARRR